MVGLWGLLEFVVNSELKIQTYSAPLVVAI